MKKVFIALLFIVFGTAPLFSQSVFSPLFRAEDTNGPMGDCLFPMDENGKIIYQGVDSVHQFSKENLQSMFDEFMQYLGKENDYDIREIEKGKSYDINISVGKIDVNVGFVQWERDMSTVRCHVKLQCKDGRYKYTVNPYETNRWTIRGEGKSDGHPNVIHWQRVNSLTKEQIEFANTHNLKREKYQKEYEEYDTKIAAEHYSYQAEYEAVLLLVNHVSNYCEELKAIIDSEEDF